MKFVAKLKTGDSIGIFSPSSPITNICPKRFERSKQFLRNKGFKIVDGSLTGKNDFYRSGNIQERAKELNELIRNQEIKCIMSTIGGMNSNSIIPYIDYKAFEKNPKIIVGHSDVTAILLAIYNKTGISTYYGPSLVSSFGELEPFVDETYDYFKKITMETIKLPHTLKIPKYWTDEYIDWETQNKSKKRKYNKLEAIYGGKVSGRLIGGNLNTMEGIWGSEYMPEIKKEDILFLEDSLKNCATVERSFSLLKVSGVLDKVSGIILGKHERFDDSNTGRKPQDILKEVLGEKRIPFIAEFDCSHTHPMITLPIGAEIELDASKKTVKLI